MMCADMYGEYSKTTELNESVWILPISFSQQIAMNVVLCANLFAKLQFLFAGF